MATKLLSIEEIMGFSGQVSENLNKAGKERAAVLKKQEQVANTAAGAAEEKGGALAIISEAKELALFKAQELNTQVAKAAGVTDDSANALLEYHAKLQETQRRAMAKAAEVRKKTETNFFDSPLQWVVDNVTLKDSQEQLAASITEMTVTQNALTGLNNTLQESFQAQAAKAETRTMASIAATTKAIAADAAVESAKYQLDGLNYNLAGIESVRQLTLDQFQLRQSTQSAVLQVRGEQRAARAEQRAEQDQARQNELFGYQKQEAELRLKLLKENVAEKELKDRLDQDFVTKFRTGLKVLGKPDMTEVELQGIMDRKRSNQVTQEHEAIYRIGAQSAAAGGKPVLGVNPAETVGALNLPGVNLPELQKKTLDIFNQAQTMIPKTIAGGKDQAAIKRSFNEQVELLVKSQYETQVAKGSAFDVGNIGDADILTIPAVASLPITKKLLTPLAANKQDMSDPKVVLDLVKAAMKKGDIGSSAAQEIATVYGFANALNQEQRNFAGLGIKLPGGGTSYKVRIGREVYDLTKAEQVQRYLMAPSVSPLAEQRTSSPFLTF